MVKVLFYNWTPVHLDKVGGGVAVYLRNILDWISEHPECDINPVILSSGFYYDNGERNCFLRREKDYRNFPVYTIVNSPVIAPMSYALADLNKIPTDRKTVIQFENLILQEGPFDVIHFETLEGLSSNVLSLKANYPKTKFVHSIHDYGIVCPNVRLWTSHHQNCFLLSGQQRVCARCTHIYTRPCVQSYKYRRPSKLEESPTVLPFRRRLQDKILSVCLQLSRTVCPSFGRVFDEYRNSNINSINKYSDAELCVSYRVAEIAEHFGICKKKLVVDYIGTKVAVTAKYQCRTSPDTPSFTILYMGYATKDKGFYFLLEALEMMDSCYTKNIVVKFATKILDNKILYRVESLKKKFDRIVVYDGYAHSDFPEIMEEVNIGIVPPQWEDNLPQVTIEMIANGIPVLTSQHGGAHELNTHPNYTFHSKEELIQRINEIMSNRVLLNEYWNYSTKLTTMKMHIDNLLKIYKE